MRPVSQEDLEWFDLLTEEAGSSFCPQQHRLECVKPLRFPTTIAGNHLNIKVLNH